MTVGVRNDFRYLFLDWYHPKVVQAGCQAFDPIETQKSFGSCKTPQDANGVVFPYNRQPVAGWTEEHAERGIVLRCILGGFIFFSLQPVLGKTWKDHP